MSSSQPQEQSYLNHIWENRIKALDGYKYRIAKTVVSFIGGLAIAYFLDTKASSISFLNEDLDVE